MDTIDIAIVGAGGACVALLQSLVASQSKTLAQGSITIFAQPGSTLGAGSVYQQDMSALLLNRPVEAMSVDFDTNAVVTARDKAIDYSQYVRGHATSGTHYYTTSMEMVAKRAQVVARHIVLSLSNNKSKVA